MILVEVPVVDPFPFPAMEGALSSLTVPLGVLIVVGALTSLLVAAAQGRMEGMVRSALLACVGGLFASGVVQRLFDALFSTLPSLSDAGDATSPRVEPSPEVVPVDATLDWALVFFGAVGVLGLIAAILGGCVCFSLLAEARDRRRESRSRLRTLRERLLVVSDEYGNLLLDGARLLAAPQVVDVSVPETSVFVDAFVKATEAERSVSPTDGDGVSSFEGLVEEAEESWGALLERVEADAAQEALAAPPQRSFFSNPLRVLAGFLDPGEDPYAPSQRRVVELEK